MAYSVSMFVVRRGYLFLLWHWHSFTISGRDSYRWICFAFDIWYSIFEFGAVDTDHWLGEGKDGRASSMASTLSLLISPPVSVLILLDLLVWKLQHHVQFYPDCEVRTPSTPPPYPSHTPAFPCIPLHPLILSAWLSDQLGGYHTVRMAQVPTSFPSLP